MIGANKPHSQLSHVSPFRSRRNNNLHLNWRSCNALLHFHLQAILLNGESESMDSMNLLRLMAPIAALMLVPAIALLEPGVLGVASRLLYTKPAFGMLLLANSSLAYIVNYTNFKLTKCTSALTLQVSLRPPTPSILLPKVSLAIT